MIPACGYRRLRTINFRLKLVDQRSAFVARRLEAANDNDGLVADCLKLAIA